MERGAKSAPWVGIARDEAFGGFNPSLGPVVGVGVVRCRDSMLHAPAGQ